MFREIFSFELKYRSKRAATLIYFAVIFVLCFAIVTTDGVKTGGAMGQVKQNAPYVLSMLSLVVSIFLCLVASAIMGVPVLRDFEHNMEALLFSTPVRKSGYLMGRFWGSFAVLLFIACSTWTAFLVGDLMWWRDKELLLSINLWNYLQPFLIFCVTNLFVCGALFFMNGTLSRKPIAVYTQGIFLLVLYLVSQTMLQSLDQRELAALLDPFGLQSFIYETQYWTTSERNQSLVPLDGFFLYNRMIWIGVGIIALIITHYCFSFRTASQSGPRRKDDNQLTDVHSGTMDVPFVAHRKFDLRLSVIQVYVMAKLYFVSVVKEIPFLGIVISGMLLLFLNATKLGEMYGTRSYPTTYQVLALISSNFGLFFFILVVFYSGELIWKERSLKMDLIHDALPVSSSTSLIAKFLGLMACFALLLLVLIGCGISIQVAYGYYNFEPRLYITSLFTDTFAGIALFTLLSIFIQVMVNNKFVGYFVCVIFLVFTSLLDDFGIEHGMFIFGSGTLGQYSDMNGYGHFVVPFVWFKSYWFGLCLLLFGIAVIFSVRGPEAVLNIRWQTGKLRVNGRLLGFIAGAALLFVSSGCYIFYNTNILNTYLNSDEQREWRAAYEKEYKVHEGDSEPKIVEANLKVDLYPDERSFKAGGFYYLKNKSRAPINDLYVQGSIDEQVVMETLTFDRSSTLTNADDKFRHFIYHLSEPLAPGDSLRMDFKIAFSPKGFREKNSNTQVVYNGTFFNNTAFFPTLGYNATYELTANDERRKQELEPYRGMPDRSDVNGQGNNMLGDDADQIRFEVVLSTAGDQIALAPGSIDREWQEKGRRYFHYKMEKPMANLYSIVSARYTVKRDKWRDVDLEIYHHWDHGYNLNRMLQAMKDALEYYSENFGPYQYRQLRVMEFPRYQAFAQSFANTIPYSEGLGFIAKVNDQERDIDYPYYVTAHEVAHQWWGHQVMPAAVKGAALLSEGMCQYAALMVMNSSFPPETIGRYLKFELDGYLKGRASERNKEQPLEMVEGQHYIYYNKASLVFFALQDYIGENNVNKAFRQFNERWRSKDGPYPVSSDLLHCLRDVMPDTLQYLVHDMFETITFFENKALEATYKEVDSTNFEVTLKVSSEKSRADSLGVETTIDLNDWIDVGVYTRVEGENKLIYLQKHKVTSKESTFVIRVHEKPSRAGIDPLHKLIDKHSDDNTRSVRERELLKAG